MSNYEPYSAPVHPPQQPPKTLLARSRTDRVLGGVCGGFANYTGLDANLIRILLVAAVVLGAGTPAIVYVAAWLLMPEE
jgi:phage shock protein PspC (stress-responsive transcriptional regulator)